MRPVSPCPRSHTTLLTAHAHATAVHARRRQPHCKCHTSAYARHTAQHTITPSHSDTCCGQHTHCRTDKPIACGTRTATMHTRPSHTYMCCGHSIAMCMELAWHACCMSASHKAGDVGVYVMQCDRTNLWVCINKSDEGASNSRLCTAQAHAQLRPPPQAPCSCLSTCRLVGADGRQCQQQIDYHVTPVSQLQAHNAELHLQAHQMSNNNTSRFWPLR